MVSMKRGFSAESPNASRILLIAFSDLAYCFIEAVIKVDDGLWPEPIAQFLARNQFPRFVEKDSQQLERLLFQPDTVGKFASPNIGFGDSKPQSSGELTGFRHCTPTGPENSATCQLSKIWID